MASGGFWANELWVQTQSAGLPISCFHGGSSFILVIEKQKQEILALWNTGW